MPKNQLGAALNYLFRVAGRRPADAESDSRLLRRFTRGRDAAALEALVGRHGPLVLATCRRLLVDPNDVEDAFQATFFVLVRRAGSISRPAQLAGWLHGVARRVAARASAARAKRLRSECRVADVPVEVPMEDVQRQELRRVLDEEVARLPARYQAPFILCYLAGRTNEEAARVLGCPDGTVFSRLARAREILRSRLARRGLTVPAALLGMELVEAAAPAAVPPEMVGRTIKGGLLVAAGPTAALGGPGAHVLALVEETLQTMSLAKVKLTALAFALLALGAGLATHHVAPGGPARADAAAAADEGPLQRENQKLRQELEQLRDKVERLERRLAALDKEAPPVTYQGKPTRHWLQQLRDRDPEYRIGALAALQVIAEEDPGVIPAIVDALRTRDQAVRDKATAVLAVLGPDAVSALPELLKQVGVGSHTFRPVPVESALLAIDPEGQAVISALGRKLKDPKHEVRRAAAGILGAYGEKAAPLVPALEAAVQDKDAEVREQAARALGKLGPLAARAVPGLLAVVKDKGEGSDVRRSAVQALASIGTAAAGAVPQLIALMNNAAEDVALRNWAIVALAKMGPPAKAAVPGLIELIKKPEGGAVDRDTAISVLEDIDPEAAQAVRRSLGLPLKVDLFVPKR